jgi:CBS domain containing-hemolysin-like protein
LGLFDVSGSLPLADLEKRLDEVLDKETPETLNKWLEEKRK